VAGLKLTKASVLTALREHHAADKGGVTGGVVGANAVSKNAVGDLLMDLMIASIRRTLVRIS